MSARTALLDAAASLATAEGVTALGVDRVVQRAGVSKGSFFYHFATKEKMVRALLDHVAMRCVDEVDTAVAHGSRFTDALVNMIARELRDNGPLISVLVASVALDPTLRATLTARRNDWRARMIDDDGLAPERAELVCLAIDGAMIGTVLYEQAGQAQRVKNAERVLRSIVKT